MPGGDRRGSGVHQCLARHVYNIELQREKVLALALDVRPLLSRIKPAIAEFQRWLDQQVKGNGGWLRCISFLEPAWRIS
jgi:hypothetical protein